MRTGLQHGCLFLAILLCGCAGDASMVRGKLMIIKQNGGYNWFSDGRALLDEDHLIVGSVAGTTARGSTAGDVQVTSFDLGRRLGTTATLASAFAVDDHVVPVLLKRPDGRYLAVFHKHDVDDLMRWCISDLPGIATQWGPVQTARANTVDDNGLCFSNVYQLSAENGRIYDLCRSVGYDPNYMISEDQGQTFHYGGHLMMWENPAGKGKGRPYIKYASNHVDTIWLATTEDHPADFDTGILAGFIKGGSVYRSDGGRIGPLSTTTQTQIKPTDFTRVFQGAPNAVAYINDLKLAADGRPSLVFSVRRDDGHDIRYNYARWDGSAWRTREIAFSGSTIYMGESSYAGLAQLDESDPGVMFISANADPTTGKPLMSASDGKRHFEIYKGTTGDQGETWKWTAITMNSSVDNIRPLIPAHDGSRRVLLWLRGTMTTYKNYDLDVVGIVEPLVQP